MPRTLVLALLLSGCLFPEEEVDCTAMAAASVNLTVSDAEGNPVDAVGEYTLAGEAADPVACESMQVGELVCGWEVEGTFEITIDAEGYVSQYVEVEVGADECHVIGEVVQVVMEADLG